MDHQKKLDFVLKMTKHALDHTQHFDTGGTALPQGTIAGTPNAPLTGLTGVGGSGLPGSSTPAGQVLNPGQSINSGIAGVLNPVVSGAGGIAGGVSSAFTTQNGYQANLAPTTSLDYGTPATTAQNNLNQGYTQSQGLLGQQGQLANQLQAETQGQGPNPAQAALNQNTGQNIAQSAALAASTRGAGTNAGLIASNAAQQGAATQQQAVGQEATQQATQQLNAQQQLQAQQAAEQSNIQGEQGIQGGLYGAATTANNAQNNTSVANYGMAQGINSQVAQNNANAVNKTESGLLGGAGSALTSLFAEGGKVPAHAHKLAKSFYPHLYADGGSVSFGEGSPTPPSFGTPNLANDTAVAASNGFGSSSGGSSGGSGGGGGAGIGALAALLAQGGKVPQNLKSGGQVPGKPKVNHDAYKNDTVDAKVSPGEVVIDLDTLKDKGKLGQMARFVAANIERKKAGRKL